MKKWISILLTLACVLTLAGCAGGEEGRTESVPNAGNTIPEKDSTPGSDVVLDTWGVTLTVRNVTPTGLTLIVTQSGGAPTGELETGSRYWLEEYRNGAWEAVPEVPTEDGVERGWDMIAYLIPMDDSVEWEINWTWIYGELPTGTYRIGKEIMDFRGTGDYDEQIYYAEFEVTDT